MKWIIEEEEGKVDLCNALFNAPTAIYRPIYISTSPLYPILIVFSSFPLLSFSSLSYLRSFQRGSGRVDCAPFLELTKDLQCLVPIFNLPFILLSLFPSVCFMTVCRYTRRSDRIMSVCLCLFARICILYICLSTCLCVSV